MKYFFSYCIIFILLGCNTETPNDVIARMLYPTVVRFSVMVNTQNPAALNSRMRLEKDYGVLLLPKSYSSTAFPIKLVIYCHSGGGSVYESSSEVEESNYCQYLCSLGYAVMDVAGMPESYSHRLNLDQGRTVGSFVAFDAYQKGYKYVIDHYKNIDRNGCFLLCNSNGGLNAGNLVNLTDIPFITQAGICPLLSTEYNAWNILAKSFDPRGFTQYQNRANIIRIFGMHDVQTQSDLNNAKYEKQKVGPYDPYDYCINRSKEPYRIPFKIFQPINDPTVEYSLAMNFTNVLNKRGSNIVIRTFKEGGHTSEPNPVVVGHYSFRGVHYNLTQTVYETAVWFSQYGGYSVKKEN